MNSAQIVKSNVAIASAITAYARITMMEFKMIPGIEIYYTDTDSIFVNKELPTQLVGKELGQMKDELDGGLIKEAYFFGIKKYAYIYNNEIKTTFSGIPKNSLTWQDVLRLVLNKSIEVKIPDQFFKSLQNLEIKIKPKNVNLTFDNSKELINNNYQNINIFDTDPLNSLTKFVKYLSTTIKKLFVNLLGSLKTEFISSWRFKHSLLNLSSFL